MPTKSYRDSLLKRLEDREYADMFLETVLEEALEDGYMDALPLALEEVIEANKNAERSPLAVDVSRKHLYQLLKDEKPLTREFTISALQTVGLDLKMKLLKAQLPI